MEKNIYDITMINNEESEPLHVSDTFDFQNITTTKETLYELNSVIKKFDDGFIHIERVYNVENQNMVVFRISMGSFDRPEHLYLLVDGEETRYFPKTPLRSSPNLKAHKILNEMLNG
jgi:tRNA (guanine-N7-)-methyltransferase